MKVICTSQCQKDRKTLYEVGKTYDIEEDMFNKNTEFFKKDEKEEKKSKKE